MQRNIKLLTISYQPCYTVFVALPKLVTVRGCINDYCIFFYYVYHGKRNSILHLQVARQTLRAIFSNSPTKKKSCKSQPYRAFRVYQTLPVLLDTVFKGTIANVFPNGINIFKIVLSCGLVTPFSILTIIGCFTPLNFSNCFQLSPFSCRAFIISPINATRKLLSSSSSCVKRESINSNALLPIACSFRSFKSFTRSFACLIAVEYSLFIIMITPLVFIQISFRLVYFSFRCFLRFFHKLM